MEAHIPRHPDSKTKKPRIEIPRPKTMTLRSQDQKATISSSCRILTLMPADSISSNKRPGRLLNFKTELQRLLEGGDN